jgi:hypothetical protein
VRADLLRVLSEVLPPGDLAREIEDLYEYGDADERRAVLRGLCGPGPISRTPEVAAVSRRLLADAMRTNDTRYEAVRFSALNPLYHHRAQLTTYLRLNEKPAPSLSGPSADEPFA